MGSFKSVGGEFNSQPEIVACGANDQFLFAFAVGTDQALWFATLDGFTFEGAQGTWSGWQSLGGVVMSPPRAVRSGESSVDVFAVGARSELLHWEFRNNAWTEWPIKIVNRDQAIAPEQHIIIPQRYQNWESLGGILMSPPHAVMFGELNDITTVWAVGTDRALWTRAREGVNGPWRPWDTLGHVLSSPPHAVTFQGATSAVFALGIDSAIWYTMGADWKSLGGTFSSAPYAVATHKHIHVFAADAQSALQHRTWDGSAWSNWESLGGILMASPTANGFDHNDLIHVFGVGTDSAVWRRRWLGDSWTDWHSLGGLVTFAPATVTRLPDPAFPTRDLVVLGTDHAVWHMEEDDS
jgi:hypothetical protein